MLFWCKGKEEWDNYLKHIEAENLYVDFFDMQVTVYELTEQGYWSHEHINPICLEAESLANISADKKMKVFRQAAEALGNYLKEKRQGKMAPELMS